MSSSSTPAVPCHFVPRVRACAGVRGGSASEGGGKLRGGVSVCRAAVPGWSSRTSCLSGEIGVAGNVRASPKLACGGYIDDEFVTKDWYRASSKIRY
jgi:hypothetical protein